MALAPSTYDMLNSISDHTTALATTGVAGEATRSSHATLPTQWSAHQRSLYHQSISASNSHPYQPSRTSAIGHTTAPSRGNTGSNYARSPSSTPSTALATAIGPSESFVVLDHHVAQSLAALPRSTSFNTSQTHGTTGSVSPSQSSAAAVNKSDLPGLTGQPSSNAGPSPASTATQASQPTATLPLSPHLNQLANVYSLLSSKSSIDYPLCTECIQVLLSLMNKELDEGKKERERLLAFEKDVLKRRDEATSSAGATAGASPSPTRENLLKEIAKYKKAENQAAQDLKAVEAEREQLDQEKAQLEKEEAELAKEEQQFWLDHSAYMLEAAALRERTNAVQTRYAHDVKELDKLQKTNVYNDAFCIGQEAGFGTINGLRLGRLPNTPVEWPEINAAWGHTLLLLHTIARKFAVTFDTYRLIPIGSFSRIEKLGPDKAVYELYGSGDFAVTRLLQNRRFDMAMVAFLDCLRQLSEHVMQRDRSFRLPHLVVKDKIGDVSIKLQFGSDETWTRALRHVLLDLKILLGRASL